MRLRLLAALVLLLLATAPAAGCGGVGGSGATVCPLVGCDDGVTFDVSGVDAFGEQALHVETCIGQACRTEVFEAEEQGQPALGPWVMRTSPPDVYEPGQRLKVSATVTDEHGEQIAHHAETITLAVFRPNGPDCPPTCAFATVEVD